MTVLQEDADFLAHHGVKGMKWGVRNARLSGGSGSSGSSSKPKKQELSPAEIQARRNKAKMVGGALLIGAGVAGLVIAKNQGVSFNSLSGKAASITKGTDRVAAWGKSAAKYSKMNAYDRAGLASGKTERAIDTAQKLSRNARSTVRRAADSAGAAARNARFNSSGAKTARARDFDENLKLYNAFSRPAREVVNHPIRQTTKTFQDNTIASMFDSAYAKAAAAGPQRMRGAIPMPAGPPVRKASMNPDLLRRAAKAQVAARAQRITPAELAKIRLSAGAANQVHHISAENLLRMYPK